MNPDLFDSLNSPQKEAVHKVQGPLMIAAGAGTGKTRTLTHRIAYLIHGAGIDPRHILAITFTNRAAREMRERMTTLLGEGKTTLLEIGTFHSVSAKILRDQIHHLGYGKSFALLSEEERLNLLRELGAGSMAEAAKCLTRISAFKNGCGEQEEAPPLFSEYQASLVQKNGLDFDDLILLVLRLFEEYPRILNRCRERFQYILVDEYQDLNLPQYRLIRLLAEPRRNLCVVGDADQAIYSFRGAHVENFLNFPKHYPDAEIIRLEQNYRSTPAILEAAEQVVSKNTKRIEKRLFTDERSGHRIRIMEVESDKEEARWIVSRVEKLLGGTSMFQHDSDRVHAGTEAGSYGLSDMAVLIRLRSQARPLLKVFEESGIPCRFLSSEPLHRHPETRAIVRLLRFLKNTDDDRPLLEILEERIKGVGPKSLETVKAYVQGQGLSLFQVLAKGTRIPGFGLNGSRSIQALFRELESFSKTGEACSLADVIQKLSEVFENLGDPSRYLETFASSYRHHSWKTALDRFLQDLCLAREVDLFDPRAHAVTLMTMHAAKGLEFPVVFIGGLEKGLMPYNRQGVPSISETEEERRLLHVSITRAMKELYLLHARKRRIHGQVLPGEASPFLQDISYTLYKSHVLKAPKRRPQTEDPQLNMFFS